MILRPFVKNTPMVERPELPGNRELLKQLPVLNIPHHQDDTPVDMKGKNSKGLYVQKHQPFTREEMVEQITGGFEIDLCAEIITNSITNAYRTLEVYYVDDLANLEKLVDHNTEHSHVVMGNDLEGMPLTHGDKLGKLSVRTTPAMPWYDDDGRKIYYMFTYSPDTISVRGVTEVEPYVFAWEVDTSKLKAKTFKIILSGYKL